MNYDMSHYIVVASDVPPRYWLMADIQERIEIFFYFSFINFSNYLLYCKSVSNVHKDIYVKEYEKNMESIYILDVKLLFLSFLLKNVFFPISLLFLSFQMLKLLQTNNDSAF